MAKTTDNYSAFNEVNLSNARSENESYEDYKKRQKQNKEIIMRLGLRRPVLFQELTRPALINPKF